MLHFDSFAKRIVGSARIHVRVAGHGPAVLLLHGFPQTHLMWRDIAPALSQRFTVVCADLPGYGQSGCPEPAPDHAPHSKRAMASSLVEAMQALGFERYSVVGHDRGARVAYRMALDTPERILRLAVLDAIPTLVAWERADARFAQSFWPWSLLAQPAPLPERLLAAAPEACVDDALSQWGSRGDAFPGEVRQAYVDALRDPAHVHAICEEYRAGATIDCRHDAADRERGHTIRCPVLALWSRDTALDDWYADAGGPLGIWRRWAGDVRGEAVPGGHFFPEVQPAATADRLQAFLESDPSAGDAGN